MFSKIEATNFLSWENLEFDIPKGISMIVGYNYDDNTAEGSGKSAVLNALCFGLFGKLPKESKIDDMIKTGTDKCLVRITLENGTVIVRSRNPNKLYISKGNSEIIRGKDAKETQTLIEAEIGMGFETFCQSVYFAQNYPNKFITANEEDKAKILSEITGVAIFDKARKRAHELQSEVARKVLEGEKLVEASDRELAAFQHEFDSLNELSEKLKLEKLTKLASLESAIEKASKEHLYLEERLKVCESGLKEAKDAEPIWQAELEEYRGEQASLKHKISLDQTRLNGIDTLKSQVVKLNSKVAKLRTELASLENPKNKTCPTCNTVLEKIDKSVFTDKASELKAEIEEKLQEVKFIEKELSSAMKEDGSEALQSKLSEIVKKASHVKTKIERMQVAENLVTQQRFEVESKERDIKKLFADLEATSQEKSVDFSDKIKEIKKKISQKEKQKVSQLEDLGQLVVLGQFYTTLKDGFREVKSYVFQGVLSELNRKANKYLSELFEVPVALLFSNTSESGEIAKIQCSVTIEGQERPLGLYSGGQFRRIQLAVDFALSDVVSARSDKSMGLLILDEPFKDLSSSSMDKVLNLLTSMKKNVILIEHNEIFKTAVNNVFEVEYRDGSSKKVR